MEDPDRTPTRYGAYGMCQRMAPSRSHAVS